MMRFAAIVIAVFLLGCADSSSEKQASKNDENSVVPVVTDESADLVFSWVGDGGPRVESSVQKVPQHVRKAVRVQDPNLSPENRDPSVMFLADLTRPGADGRYPVKTIKRAEYEARRRAVVPIPISTPGTGSDPTVVMFSTRHCPICVKARRWLLEKKIPYVERDLERDKQAAQDLQKMGQAQGVPTNGVPIFEIGGRLLPGFDKARILATLKGLPETQKSI